MNLTLFNFTEVIVGEAHNPTILNPDFLAVQNIVPKEWGWRVAETVTTPPLALVRYENGVSVTVEPQKIQVGDSNAEQGPAESKVPQIAAAYVKTLPHVRYTAVGTNFHSFIEMPDPAAYLKKRFLKHGSWDTERHPLHAVGCRLVYLLPADCRATLSIDFGEVTPQATDQKVPAILVNGNFHRECTERSGATEVETHLTRVDSDWSTYQMLVHDALDIEE